MQIQELLKSLEASVAGSAPNVAHIRTQLNVIEERYRANKKAKVDRDSGSKEVAPAVPVHQHGQQQEPERSTLRTPALSGGGSRASLAFVKAISQPDWSGTRKWDRLVQVAQNKPDRSV
jgi:hypothetical protein